MSLQLDPHKLPRSALDERFQRAIDDAIAKQRAGRVPADRGGHGELELDDGVRFVPDGQDAKRGLASIINGAIAGVFGVLVLVVAVDGAHAEPWMPYAGALLIGSGLYLVSTGRARRRLALAAPRLTGAYLFPDVLVHVSTFGCRTFPIDRVRGFDYRSSDADRSPRMMIRFSDDAGDERTAVLFHHDATASLEAWLAARRR